MMLLQEASDAAVPPDVVGFSAAISACGVCSEWPWGLELLRNMGARAIPPDRIAFDAAISACALGIQWESGLALLASMGSREICPDEVSFNAAMSCCERSGRWMEALSLFALITELQPRPDAVSVGLACSAVAAAPWPLASALLGDLLEREVLPTGIMLGSGRRNIRRQGCGVHRWRWHPCSLSGCS